MIVDAPPGSDAEREARADRIRAVVRLQHRAQYDLAMQLLAVERGASFGVFCDSVGVHRVAARRYMRVARLFSKEDIVTHGMHKLDVIAFAPEAVRAALLDRLRAGATRDELVGLAAGRTQKKTGAALQRRFKPGEVQKARASFISPLRGPAYGVPCEAAFDYGPVRFIVRVRAELDGSLYVEHEVARATPPSSRRA